MSKATTANLINSVFEFKKQKEVIKNRQRLELESELFDWRADIGDEILRLRKQKAFTIEQIGEAMGIRNRTFIYDAISAANQRSNPADDAVTPVGATETPDPGTSPFRIEYFDSAAKVSFPPYGEDEEVYEIVVVDGQPDIPEEWADHTRERRLLYKDVTAEIRNYFRNG